MSWWWRDITIPESAKGKHIILHFEAVRLRAEVFLNNQLVGYDVIGNTPFDVDITGKAKPGKNTLAVRVTDPSGNFDWVDWYVHKWGDYNIPASHGFGGIFQPVSLIITDPIYVSDIFVKNKPTLTSVDVDVTLSNATGKPVRGSVEIAVKQAGKTVRTQTIPGVEFAGGRYGGQQEHKCAEREALGPGPPQPVLSAMWPSRLTASLWTRRLSTSASGSSP